MIFQNNIKFKHGNLKRGDGCLYRGKLGIYMGSYIENNHKIHMIKVHEISSLTGGLPLIQEYIAMCDDPNDIVCKVQEYQPPEEQMTLC